MVVERQLVVIVPCFETMLRHPDINLCINGSGDDSSLIGDTTSETHAIKRERSLFLQLHLLISMLVFVLLLFPRIFALWHLMMFAVLLMQL